MKPDLTPETTTVPLVPHWIDGTAVTRSPERRGDVYDPSTGRVTKQVAFAAPADVDEAVAAAAPAFDPWRHDLAGQADQGALRVPRAAPPQGRRAGRHHHRRARQGARAMPGRGGPGPRGGRVRLRHLPAHEGRLLRGGVDGGRRLLDPPAPRVSSPSSARSTSRPWCRAGSSPSPSPPATRSSSSRARRIPRPPTGWPSCGPRPGCPPGSSTSSTATRWPSTGLLEHPERQGGLLRRARPPSPGTSTRRRTATASGSRPSAGPRTTWSCCPTPTSTWPPTPPSTPGSARPASAAWPSRSWSPSSRWPTTSSPGSPSAWPG